LLDRRTTGFSQAEKRRMERSDTGQYISKRSRERKRSLRGFLGDGCGLFIFIGKFFVS
jgi:hypothetical protein